MAVGKRQNKRKGRQLESGLMPWTPRRAKWRAELDTKEIRDERFRQRYFERGGKPQDKLLGEGKSQAQISAEHHFMGAINAAGQDERDPALVRHVDPIHGVIKTRGVENEILKHPLFARLTHIKQTEQMVSGYYIGATHTRHAHSLGTMHLAGRIARNLNLPAETVKALRVAAMLHDIGHTAFSHGAEPIILRKLGMNHEQLGEHRMRRAGIPRLLGKHGIDFEEVMRYSRGEGLGEIISEYADRMDYLQRDGHYSGITPQVRRGLKLAIEEIIRNLRTRDKWQICIAPEGEAALKHLADTRTLFYSQVYFFPPSMLARHFLQRALAAGMRRRIITVKDLQHSGDHEVLDKIAKAGIIDADLIHLSNTYMRFEPVFTAHFDKLTPGARMVVQREGIKKKLEAALKRAGLKTHEYYVGATPEVEKELKYKVLHGDGRVEAKRYVPESKEDEKMFFVWAISAKAAKAKEVMTKYARAISRSPNEPPSLIGGTEKV